ncbi:ABC transporter permease [Nordella sp. HKS 07]|uniref:ABC transporter permease n=1 Tax=Nordella sp. HKS 07 TaxID=2712222 RepID=UPI0013E11944|nr:ABC transporter permease [Nordella sp. HKS 07]QIG52235.1 ABC transporter permease [Nordella sp. HKS 07]
MTEMGKRWLVFLGVAFVPALLIVAPITSFLVLSLYRAEKNLIIREITFGNYANFFGNWTYFGTFLGTVLLCLEVMGAAVLIGYPVAWFIWQQKGSRRYLLLLLAVMPLFMSYIVKLYTLRSMLGLNGLVNQALLGLGILERPSQAFLFNQRAVLITMVVIYLPFVILPIFLALERIPRSLLQASLDLGAGGWDTFRRIVLPLSLPGTVAGALFAFVLALGDFVTPQMVGGTTGFTIGRVIYSQFGLAYDWPFGAAMATILFVTALFGILLAGYSISRQRV